ncbi:hypothetical protein B0H14DRAFT_3455779 [Mycena olivaceomarginata]|nr:hypothetical protein B0H14DRAFT_3455779 [Mycena olivaceomarginata]
MFYSPYTVTSGITVPGTMFWCSSGGSQLPCTNGENQSFEIDYDLRSKKRVIISVGREVMVKTSDLYLEPLAGAATPRASKPVKGNKTKKARTKRKRPASSDEDNDNDVFEPEDEEPTSLHPQKRQRTESPPANTEVPPEVRTTRARSAAVQEGGGNVQPVPAPIVPRPVPRPRAATTKATRRAPPVVIESSDSEAERPKEAAPVKRRVSPRKQKEQALLARQPVATAFETDEGGWYYVVPKQPPPAPPIGGSSSSRPPSSLVNRRRHVFRIPLRGTGTRFAAHRFVVAPELSAARHPRPPHLALWAAASGSHLRTSPVAVTSWFPVASFFPSPLARHRQLRPLLVRRPWRLLLPLACLQWSLLPPLARLRWHLLLPPPLTRRWWCLLFPARARSRSLSVAPPALPSVAPSPASSSVPQVPPDVVQMLGRLSAAQMQAMLMSLMTQASGAGAAPSERGGGRRRGTFGFVVVFCCLLLSLLLILSVANNPVSVLEAP